jgi:hypothetical protein
VSTIATGTEPVIVNSTTPVDNLNADPRTYDSAGTQQTHIHMTYNPAGPVIIGAGGYVTITLAGSAAYTNSSSYRCTANDSSAALPVAIQYVDGSRFNILGTPGDGAQFMCIGF